MKRRTTMQFALVLIMLAAIWGCGSGGSNSVETQGTQKSVLLLSAPVKGIDITLVLPAGATVKADPDTGETLPGVITLSGPNAGLANSYPLGKYTAATATEPGKVRIVLMSNTAFVAGEFFTVICDVASGVTLVESDFGYEGLVLYDAATGNAITTGVSATITF